MQLLPKNSHICTRFESIVHQTVRSTSAANQRVLTRSLRHHRETITFIQSAGSPLLSKLQQRGRSPDHRVQTACIGAADLLWRTLERPRRGRLNRRHILPTHHFEVFGAALHPAVVAGEQHVLDVVARSVVELAHVEGAGLVAVKVGPLLQDLQHVLLDQVRVPDLVPGKLRSRVLYISSDNQL